MSIFSKISDLDDRHRAALAPRQSWRMPGLASGVLLFPCWSQGLDALLCCTQDSCQQCRASRKAASLEAALASAEAKAAALQAGLRELQAENASLGASLSAARAERNALNAAVRQAVSLPISARSDGHCVPLLSQVVPLRFHIWCKELCILTCCIAQCKVQGLSRRCSAAHAVKLMCRASSSRDRLISPSEHSGSSAALASARADAAQLKEENTRLLDLLSTVSILSA